MVKYHKYCGKNDWHAVYIEYSTENEFLFKNKNVYPIHQEDKLDFENEKRKYPRVEVNWPVTIYIDNETIEGETSNISVEGVSLQCDKPLPVNKDFSILISPPEHQAIDLKGRVVWSDLYGIDGTHKRDVYGIGACLVKLSEEDKQTVREMLNNYL